MIKHLKEALLVPEVRRRILFTALLLIVYRVGTHIPMPGINLHGLRLLFGSGTPFGIADLCMGEALRRLSILAVGIMPYIGAATIFQLLAAIVPQLKTLQQEGDQGRRKINAYTYCLAAFLAALEAFGIATELETLRGPNSLLVAAPDWIFRAQTTITLTAGTIFLIWMANQITRRGIWNGVALLIFASIVVQVPEAVKALAMMVRVGETNMLMVPVLALGMVLVTSAVVIIWLGQRRITVAYSRRVVSQRVYEESSIYLPLRVNAAGVIPLIFASFFLALPGTFAQFGKYPWAEDVRNTLAFGGPLYAVLYAGLIILFTYLYSAMIFNPAAVPELLAKSRGFIPNVDPGQDTAKYIGKVMNCLTFIGALFLVAISMLPELMILYLNVPFYFGGISLVIVVGVALNMVQEVDCYLIMRRYTEGCG